MRPHDRQRLYEDTPLEFEEKWLELWRATTIERRLAKLCSIGASVNELARAALRARYPDATPREIDLRLVSRSVDRETMIAAFGWDPAVHGQ